ncbi:hypothetical protein [Parendozoicomonas haliclonae]|uniref:Uncharacterized protein n=1 Tax=Parendozoicomonas haliclonae TaxID=1960125 RepID=A0A1X7AIR8_9GAMM|nr:hypothetical protein [Parendozoicomonas haliclonae]SMA45644.1 hypothetical protein EHSB41UT_01969 [Parendozoicomonas haliclonae]
MNRMNPADKQAIKQQLSDWMQSQSNPSAYSKVTHNHRTVQRTARPTPGYIPRDSETDYRAMLDNQRQRKVSTSSSSGSISSMDSGRGTMSNSSSLDSLSSLSSDSTVSGASGVSKVSDKSSNGDNPVMKPGDLLIFESSSNWGQAMIKLSAGDEPLPMGHVCMMIGHKEGADPASTDPADLLFVTTDIRGVGTFTLEEIMETYREEYSSAWILPIKHKLSDDKVAQFKHSADHLTEHTTFYNIPGALIGLTKMLAHIQLPTPENAKAKGKYSFCSQAVAQVLSDSGLQPADLKSHEVPTASLAYMIDKSGNFIFSNQARHIHDYYPERYFDDHDPVEFEARPSRILDPAKRLEKTFMVVSRSKEMQNILQREYKKLSDKPKTAQTEAENRMQQLAGMKRENCQTKKRDDSKPLVETVDLYINGLWVPVPITQCVDPSKLYQSQEVAPGVFAIAV